MHLIYIDDSRDPQTCVFSVLAIPAEKWRECFQGLRAWRQELRRTHGMYVRKELHAWKFVSGRGRAGDKTVTKYERSQIFRQALALAAEMPGARLFNAVFPRKLDERAFERMLNRINRTLEVWGSHAVLFCDQGKEAAYTRLVRKMAVFNPIPSRFGTWRDSGRSHRNVPIGRILEDPVFKRSEQSFFIQLVDFVAYALLRRERPVASRSKYNIHKAFDELAAILVREATNKDPEGILRP